MKVKLLFFIIPILFFSNCSTRITKKLITQGAVQQAEFRETLPFKNLQNWIIVEATVNGSAKKYRFLFDTGAVSVVSSKMMEELGLKTRAKNNVGSSTVQRKKTAFTEMKEVSIQGVNFKDVGAVVVDFDTSPEMKCLSKSIDGIIGSNLMKHAVWQINFETQQIIFADSRQKLPAYTNEQSVPFSYSGQASPKVMLHLFGKKIRATFDTGKNGGIGINRKQMKDLDFSSDSVQCVKGYGQTAIGVFGAVSDTNYTISAKGMSWGGWNVDTVIVSSSYKSSTLIGNNFSKNFIVTLDWKSKTISFAPQKGKKQRTQFETFGFSYTLEEDKLVVSYLIEGSSAHKANIPLGSHILTINNRDVQEVSLDDFCSIKKNKLLKDSIHTINMTYKTPNGETKTATLVKERLL